MRSVFFFSLVSVKYYMNYISYRDLMAIFNVVFIIGILVSSLEMPRNSVSAQSCLAGIIYAKVSRTQFSSRNNDTLTTSLIVSCFFFFCLLRFPSIIPISFCVFMCN